MGSPQSNDALPELIAQYRRVLLGYILAIVRNHHLAEDVYQETLMVLARQWSAYGEVHSFVSLAREIARRQALAALRRSQRSTALLSEDALDALDSAFEHRAMDEARIDALEHCLAKTPPLWQGIVRMRYWEAASVTDIAAALGRSVNTISVTLNRARIRLADCIRDSEMRRRSA